MSKIDFSCKICGKQCDIASNPPDRAICPQHCEDHHYIYIDGERRYACNYCGQEPPFDWHDYIEEDYY